MKILVKAFLLLAVLSTLSAGFSAQQPTLKSEAKYFNPSPIVIAQVTGDNLRFTAFGLASRMRLEVFDQNGNSLFDSEYRLGNLIEWPLKNQQGGKLLDGEYSCLITLEGQSGVTNQRQAFFFLRTGQVYFDKQSDKATVFSGDSEPIYFMQPDAPLPFIAHDGSDARIESNTGGLTLQAGRLSSGAVSQIPHMHLTPAGNLGIGIANPETTLDVAGLVRTSQGIQFPDGTIQRTAAANGTVIGLVEKTGSDSRQGDRTDGLISNRISNPGDVVVPRGLFWSPDGERRITAGSGRITPVAATESPTNTFYGLLAGNLTSGVNNAFFGRTAGQNNTTGNSNTFIGDSSGASNITDSNNSYLGALADGTAGITNATAVGYRAKVSQSDSIVLGSINGINGATADVKVGIGISSPENKFQVAEASGAYTRGVAFDQYGDHLFASAFRLRKSRGATPGSHVILQNNDNVFNFQGQGSDGTQFIDLARMRFEVDGTPGVSDMPGRITFHTTPDGAGATVERMRITNAGNVGIGTTAPVEKLDVNGNVRGASFIATSDFRLKENIQPVNYGLREVLKLNPVTWTWKNEPAGKTQLGLIAQDVEKVIPEVVSKGKDELGMRGLNYTALVPVLIKAMQEQQQIIQSQNEAMKVRDERISTLESRLAALEEAIARIRER